VIRYIGFRKPDHCPDCLGAGRLHRVNPPLSYDCTRCNGTGIRGNPACLVLIILGSIAAWVIGLGWYVLS
jgi:hypothetical protein